MESMQVTGKDESFSYRIVWEDDFCGLVPCMKEAGIDTGKCCIITDDNVEKLYLDTVRSALEAGGYHTSTFVFKAGETSKHLGTVQEIYKHLLAEHFERCDTLVALGGGVTGDITGFAAASYLRGIDFIQIPTTLLAQVDSSIGGKTGVDFDQYKNIIGAFNQPALVYMNTHVLESLDERQFASGMAEVLKSGLIKDADFYEWTISHMSQIEEREHALLDRMVRDCCRIKKSVVEEDPKEHGIRAILNFGHTIGHAVEKMKEFELLHGECVALGMVAAAFISHKRGMLSTEELYEIRDMQVGFGLPIMVDGLTSADILLATKCDKKMSGGQIRFILLSGIGSAVIDETVTKEEMLAAIDFINGDLIDGE